LKVVLLYIRVMLLWKRRKRARENAPATGL
jgi:hypothetical protein